LRALRTIQGHEASTRNPAATSARLTMDVAIISDSAVSAIVPREPRSSR
jgi:hypothetical protein